MFWCKMCRAAEASYKLHVAREDTGVGAQEANQRRPVHIALPKEMRSLQVPIRHKTRRTLTGAWLQESTHPTGAWFQDWTNPTGAWFQDSTHPTGAWFQD